MIEDKTVSKCDITRGVLIHGAKGYSLRIDNEDFAIVDLLDFDDFIGKPVQVTIMIDLLETKVVNEID